MKYLRKYNEETIPNSLLEFNCKHKTGYSEEELIDIFTLNLEDNKEFDVIDASAEVVPGELYRGPDLMSSITKGIVAVKLTEDFSNNKDYLSQKINYDDLYVNSMLPIVKRANKKLLDVIGKKYDLVIDQYEGYNWVKYIVYIEQGWARNTKPTHRYEVGFSVNKIDKK